MQWGQAIYVMITFYITCIELNLTTWFMLECGKEGGGGSVIESMLAFYG